MKQKKVKKTYIPFLILAFTITLHIVFLWQIHKMQWVSTSSISYLTNLTEPRPKDFQEKMQKEKQKELSKIFSYLKSHPLKVQIKTDHLMSVVPAKPENTTIKKEIYSIPMSSLDPTLFKNYKNLSKNLGSEAIYDTSIPLYLIEAQKPLIQKILENQLKTLPPLTHLSSLEKEKKISTSAKPKIDVSFDTFSIDAYPFIHEIPFIKALTKKSPISSVISSQDFSTQVSYSNHPYKKGFLFQVKLSLSRQIYPQRMKHHICFLIHDPSTNKKNSSLWVQTLKAALKNFHPEDTFNIVTYDKKVIKLFESPQHINEGSLKKGITFLQNLQNHTIANTEQLYSCLDEILLFSQENDRINSAVLLSTENCSYNESKDIKKIAQWTLKNSPKLSLFTLTSNKNPQIALIELLSRLYKGQLYYVDNDRAFPKLTANLIASIAHPIAKEITIAAYSQKGERLLIFPYNQQMSHLYYNRPIYITGYISELSPVSLHIQGYSLPTPLNIELSVPFNKATVLTNDVLMRQWALFEASRHYYDFLLSGSSAHIDKAKEKLQPYQIPLAFLE